MKDLLARGILGTFSLLFRTLPRHTTLWLGRCLGGLIYRLDASRRKTALDNLQMALGNEMNPEQIRTIARRSFQSLGMIVAEFFTIPTLDAEGVDRIMSLTGEEHLRKALSQGNGVILLSAHLGNWELLGASLALKGYPLALISKIARSEAVNRLWMGNRQKAGVGILKGRGVMKESIKHLANGGIVGFVLDQNARRTEGVFVPFFGKQACTLASLAILARRTGVPVVPAHIFRVGKRHQIVIEGPLESAPESDKDKDILERTKVYTRWTEKIIRLHPEQWTWLHERWKTRPLGESGVPSTRSRA